MSDETVYDIIDDTIKDMLDNILGKNWYIELYYNYTKLDTDTWGLLAEKIYSTTTSNRFKIYTKENEVVSEFSLERLPGCCGVLVSYHAKVYKKFRDKGVGRLLNLMRINFAEYMKVGKILCTTLENNEVQNHILEVNGWTKYDTFTNPRTGNSLNLWSINLKEDKK